MTSDCEIEEEVAFESGSEGESKMNPYPSLDLWRVRVTTHAYLRFINRYFDRLSEKLTLFELLSWATEDRVLPAWCKRERLKRHHGEEARYFTFGRWRFVIVEMAEILLIVTFEETHAFSDEMYVPSPAKRPPWWSPRRNKGKKKKKNRWNALAR